MHDHQDRLSLAPDRRIGVTNLNMVGFFNFFFVFFLMTTARAACPGSVVFASALEG
jgi:hypothetical protein